MKAYLTALFILLIACNEVKTKTSSPEVHKEVQSKTSIHKKVQSKTPEKLISESFADSSNIGIKGKNKITIQKIIHLDSAYVEINFFQKDRQHWVLKQNMHFKADMISNSDPQIIDFNNDGFKDMTYQSAVAARGANELRTLFIFDKKSGLLKRMVNSEKYPNLEYNEYLNCITGWAVYGGTTTSFLKVEKDSLIRFANVDIFDGYIEAYEVKNGQTKRLIRKKMKDDDIYIRYKNYKPLEE